MTTTLVADHLESVLLEIQFASQDIARRAADPESSSYDVEKALLRFGNRAARVGRALDFAEKMACPNWPSRPLDLVSVGKHCTRPNSRHAQRAQTTEDYRGIKHVQKIAQAMGLSRNAA